jgi:hypothetical protein
VPRYMMQAIIVGVAHFTHRDNDDVLGEKGNERGISIEKME